MDNSSRIRWLTSILDSIHDGVLVVDISSTILYANPAYTRNLGVPVARVLGRKLSDIEPASKILEVLRTGRQIVDDRSHIYSLNMDIVANITPIYDKATLIGAVAVFRDISEIQALQEKIQQTEHEMEKVKDLSSRYFSELQQLRSRFLALEEFIFESPQMRHIIETVLQIARVDSTVLISGESGVGKEIIAKLIHRASSRKEGPFIAVNCGAIPENLLESEFFGYEKGAFTGASKSGKAGLLELAQHGTLFLDEIGELPLNLQVKFLRVLQEQSFIRVGGLQPIRLDTRFITATNRDLKEMVKNKLFRSDLYYRINVIPIHIPPLRERRLDIMPLAQFFLKKYNKKYDMKKKLSPEAIKALENYPWPGNVRELENLIERLVVSSGGNLINIDDQAFRDYLGERAHTEGEIFINEVMNLKKARGILERQLINRAIKICGSTRKAAQALGVDHSTVIRKAKKYKIGES
ncbi:MAG: sigma-54 interaction domain-containing protein [Bacillota bacterium]